MLSKKTKYGIKALVYIAKQEAKIISIRDIAEQEHISQKFLESILLSLKKTGIVGSKKGKTGGYYLLKDPSEISMTAVMRTLEGPIAMLPCVSLNFYEKCEDCPSEETCSIHTVMEELRDASLSILNSKSLKDLI
ncbi:RrF2 family transcriptional regulator [Aurantibacter aestuarii]|uniref:Transcriptional regulator n=1 Tax=Aurantibacter aestuarii TaxID=1266046 RepID=A0A2T1NEA2_9FLAO|nr:Rrf2 family transcriptional regulator [Aurantibacter aestuarii]PSG90774.1 transcriptional regulator [Aurantibacter aestuarii]